MPPAQSRLHINLLELLAVFLALKASRQLLLGLHVRIQTDNVSFAAYVSRPGCTKSMRLHELAHRLMLWCQGKSRWVTQTLGTPSVDPFAARTNTQCNLWFSRWE